MRHHWVTTVPLATRRGPLRVRVRTPARPCPGRRRISDGTIRRHVEAGTARTIRDKFTTELLEPVVSRLGAGHEPLRAALVMSQILGVS